jgi:hypothetical protein
MSNRAGGNVPEGPASGDETPQAGGAPEALPS